jgi:PAS domain S-box-containing protein
MWFTQALQLLKPIKILSVISVVLFLLNGLYVASLYNYLLFHGVAECFSIVVSCGIFMVAWNTRRYHTHHYLVPIGVAYLCVSFLDLIHMLAYSGMNIFTGYNANIPTQLWIAARYLQSLTLLVVSFGMFRRVRPAWCFLLYFALTLAVVYVIFFTHLFPDCFLPNAGGLTPFKKASEFIICIILITAMLLFLSLQNRFDPEFIKWLILSIGVTALSEFAFTAYVGVYGFSNMVGHIFKIAASYLMYKAVIEIGLAKPFDLLFSDLNRERERLRIILASVSEAVVATDGEGRITFANSVAESLTGWHADDAKGASIRNVFCVRTDSNEPSGDTVVEALYQGRTIDLGRSTTLIRKDDGEIPIVGRVAAINHPDGNIAGVVLTFRDIRDQLLAEAGPAAGERNLGRAGCGTYGAGRNSVPAASDVGR